MKKFNLISILTIILLLSSCNYNEPDTIIGKWYVSHLNPDGKTYTNFMLQFNNNGTYCSYLNGERAEKGEYIYSFDTKELYTFNRTFDGYPSFITKDTLVEKAYVQDNILYTEWHINSFDIITKYHR